MWPGVVTLWAEEINVTIQGPPQLLHNMRQKDLITHYCIRTEGLPPPPPQDEPQPSPSHPSDRHLVSAVKGRFYRVSLGGRDVGRAVRDSTRAASSF